MADRKTGKRGNAGKTGNEQVARGRDQSDKSLGSGSEANIAGKTGPRSDAGKTSGSNPGNSAAHGNLGGRNGNASDRTS